MQKARQSSRRGTKPAQPAQRQAPLTGAGLVRSYQQVLTNQSSMMDQRVLREAGLVDTEPAGRYTYYRLVPERLERLSGQLTELATRARRASKVKRPCC